MIGWVEGDKLPRFVAVQAAGCAPIVKAFHADKLESEPWPDPTTFAILPWEKTPTARLICDLGLPGGALFRADPRAVLRAALQRATEQGFNFGELAI